MLNSLIITTGKIISKFIRLINAGNGTTWPGHIALKLNPHFINDLKKKSNLTVILVIGTNGKTTTTSLLSHIFTAAEKKVIQNESGANLSNGIASAFLLNSSILGDLKADIAIFEVDENAFSTVANMVTPDAVIILNLFRDQLDRYGELNTIALKWKKTLDSLPPVDLFLNADDPQIAYLEKDTKHKVYFFGADPNDAQEKNVEHASDSIYCPNCGEKLHYSRVFYSHMGIWNCTKCHYKHSNHVFRNAPFYPLSGLYNKYNIHAAVLVAKTLGVLDTTLQKSLTTFKPVFGRQETLIIDGKKVQIILAKNPSGFNQALKTILDQNPKVVLLLLNDRIADGNDISWIWDTDVELLKNAHTYIFISGDRAWDLGLRIKYADFPQNTFTVIDDLPKAVVAAINSTKGNETLFILPTYTAMLEIRKLLTGKKIL